MLVKSFILVFLRRLLIILFPKKLSILHLSSCYEPEVKLTIERNYDE